LFLSEAVFGWFVEKMVMLLIINKMGDAGGNIPLLTEYSVRQLEYTIRYMEYSVLLMEYSTGNGIFHVLEGIFILLNGIFHCKGATIYYGPGGGMKK